MHLYWHQQKSLAYDITQTQEWASGKRSTWVSAGQLAPEGLRPERYSEKTSTSSERATHFDAAHAQVIFSNNSPSQPLLAGMQDRLSILIQLGGLLAAQTPLPAAGSSIDVPVATLSQAGVWHFEIAGLDASATPDQKTGPWLKVEHHPSQAWEPDLIIWYDTQYFLPARIQTTYTNGQVHTAQRQDGDPYQPPPIMSTLK